MRSTPPRAISCDRWSDGAGRRCSRREEQGDAATVCILGLVAAMSAPGSPRAQPTEGAVVVKSPCPAGTRKVVWVCIDKQPRAVADFNAASADCADEGRRLPCE